MKLSGGIMWSLRKLYLIMNIMMPVMCASQPVDSLLNDARMLMLRDPNGAEEILMPAYVSAIKEKAYKDVVPLLHQLAIVAIIKGDHLTGISYNREAVTYAMLSGDSMIIGNSLTKLAKDYRKSGYPDSATASCIKAIHHYNAIKEEGNAWACYTILGNVARDAGRIKDAEEYYLKAWEVVLKLHKSKDEFIVAGILQNFYVGTGNQEKYANILEILLQRYPYFTEDLNESNAHYHSLLRLYDADKESVENFRKSVALHRQLNQPVSLLAGMTRLGKLLTMEGNYNAGFDTLSKALTLSTHTLPGRMMLHYMIYENRKAAGDLPSALNFLTRYHALKDSINSEKSIAAIRKLEVEYKTREKELALLQEKERTRTRTMQRNAILIASGFIVFISMLGILFFWNRARLQKKLALQEKTINEQQIHQLTQEKKLLAMSSMIEGQEAERKRIAQDLHDGLGGLLSSVKAQFNLIQHHVSMLESMDLYSKANTLIDNASTELRRIAYNMMPSALSRLGLASALEDLSASLQADHSLDVSLQIIGLKERPGETIEIMLYRIVQELCNNVVKHAKASHLLIQLNKTPDEIFLVVEDNGIGLDPEKIMHKDHLGMKSIESRVKFLNGTVDISGTPGKGTCVTIHIPLPQ